MIGGIIGLLFFAVAVVAFVFWIWMLVDCIRNPRLSGNERVIWALVVFFLYALGGLIYFLVGRNKSA